MFIQRRRPELSQNFLRSPQLVQRLVQGASFAASDTILEIGPGKGIITQELLREAHQVLAVELDARFVEYLQHKFQDRSNLILFQTDFLDFHLPATKYKVFANTPFAVEGDIIRKLLDAHNPPQETHLVLIKDVAERWAGHRHGTQFSAMYAPWFEFKIVHHFSRQDFDPAPRIDSVLLRITQRMESWLPIIEKEAYHKFIKAAFGGGRRLDQNLRSYFTKPQMKKIGHDLKISFFARPSDVKTETLVKLFTIHQKLNHYVSKNTIK